MTNVSSLFTERVRYVHANYRFIVDPQRDYEAQSIDADTYLDWNTILQIIASPQSQSAACPICLGDPIAPRMAKCGHIFCLHCLIRYMQSSDEESSRVPEKKPRWKKCPLCWDSIYISEVRPVKWYSGQEGQTPHEGGDIVLRLVMRPAGCTLALPKESASSNIQDGQIPWHFAADVMDFARVMKGSEEYMNMAFDEEIAAIEQLERHDELMFGEDTEWTRKAIRAVNENKERVKGIGNPPPSAKPEEKPKRKPIVFNESNEDVPDMYSVNHAARAGQSLADEGGVALALSKASPSNTSPDNAASALSTSLAQFKAGRVTSQQPSDYYFYQALLHYYLSPLDIRILKSAFGDFSAFPTTILPRIERISTGHVVDDELRKRAKYLAHLPHGCEISFLECDWTDIVDADTLEKFRPDLEKRRKKNIEKETREEKERIRAEKEEESKRYAGVRRSNRPSSPVEMFKPDDFTPLGTSVDAVQVVGSPDALAAASASPPWGSRKAKGSAFASLASPSTSPSHSRTVWGTSAVPASEMSPTLQAQSGGPMDDGWLQGWEKELLAEEDIVAQVQAASLEGVAGSSKAAGTSSGGGPGKKKKGKKITLMSTNARRGA